MREGEKETLRAQTPRSPLRIPSLEIIGARHNNLKNINVSDSARHAHRRHRRQRQRQELAGRGHPLQPARQDAASREHRARRARSDPRHRADQQGDPRRSAAARQHADVEPGHLHRRVRPDSPAVFATARIEAARLHGPAIQLQRARRPLRSVRRQRPEVHPDALPARRLGRVRNLPRPALQPATCSKSSSTARASPTC